MLLHVLEEELEFGRLLVSVTVSQRIDGHQAHRRHDLHLFFVAGTLFGSYVEISRQVWGIIESASDDSSLSTR